MKTLTRKASAKMAEKTNGVPAVDEKTAKIARALELQSAIKALGTELNEIKEYFLDTFNSDKSQTLFVTSAGAVKVSTTNSYSCEPASIPDLKKIFKENYAGFVTEKTTYGVSAALKKLLLDADYKHKDVIRNAVVIKTSQSVVFEPVKG